MTPEQHRRLLEIAPEAAESYKKRCERKISETLGKVSSVDPLPLLAAEVALNSIHVGDYFEPTSHQSEAKIEFAMALLASLDLRDCHPIDPSPEQLHAFIADVDEAFELARLGNVARTLSEHQTAEPLAAFRFDTVSRHLAVRGMCYPQHGIDLAAELYGDLSPLMKARLGFDVADVVQFVDRLSARMEDRFNSLVEAAGSAAEQLVRQRPTLIGRSQAVSAEDAFASAAGLLLFGNLAGAFSFTLWDAASCTDLPEPTVQAILERFSLALGERAYSRPHPMKASPAARYPIARHGGRYMLALAGRLERELPLLLDKPVRAISPRLGKRKDQVVTRLTIQYITEMLPDAKAAAHVYYTVRESGKDKRVETDGIVIFDRCLFVIEGKPGSLSPQAESGADMARLLSELEANAVAAVRQGERTRRFIFSRETARFRDESGVDVIEIRARDFDHVFSIVPMLYSLGDHGSQLPRLASLEMLQEDDHAFCVYVNDLRVIAESVTNPIEFIHYLRWRDQLPLGDRVRIADELDLFATFLLRQQHRRRLSIFGGWISAVGSTTDFDDYYLPTGGGRPRREEPPRMFHKVAELKRFVDWLASERPTGWLDAGGVCLELSLAELAVLQRVLEDLPHTRPNEGVVLPLTSADVNPALDPTAVSLAVVTLGDGMTWRDAWDELRREVFEVERVVFCREERGRSRIVWALENTNHVGTERH